MLFVVFFHSDKCYSVSHCGLDLHFLDDKWCWTYFHESVHHLYAFFGKMSIQSLCPFLNLIFLILSCMSFCTFYINSLCDTSFANIFFPFSRWSFYLIDRLIVSFLHCAKALVWCSLVDLIYFVFSFISFISILIIIIIFHLLSVLFVQFLWVYS